MRSGQNKQNDKYYTTAFAFKWRLGDCEKYLATIMKFLVWLCIFVCNYVANILQNFLIDWLDWIRKSVLHFLEWWYLKKKNAKNEK